MDSDQLLPFKVVFRPIQIETEYHQANYYAPRATIERIADDFKTGKTAAFYEVFTSPEYPRTLAIHFADVLYIG